MKVTAILKCPGQPGISLGQEYSESLKMLASFRKVMVEESVAPLFQPIVDLQSGSILGYEGLIRGPSNSPLHVPNTLFNVARMCGATVELERLCRRVHIEQFSRHGLEGRLFLNMSPDVLVNPELQTDTCFFSEQVQGISPESIVIELTESSSAASYNRIKQAASDYRAYGFQVAIDDLGEGFSSLRLWSELRPEFVKIDKYFIQGIDKDPIKRQFVRSIFEIAQQSYSKVIAEGIETEAEYITVRDVGIQYGQGYWLGRPAMPPVTKLPAETLSVIGRRSDTARPNGGQPFKNELTVRKILRAIPAVVDATPTNAVYGIFERQPELQALAVLREGAPIGLIQRLRMLDRLARPYHRELYGNKPCSHFIENEPLIVDIGTSLRNLSYLITEGNPQHLSDGFIIIENGDYRGVGTGSDLIREITQMQIHAARYANPLTQLPGNVPINEHIESLLADDEAFAVCYADLDNFKPFNDLYSYHKGDEVIQITAGLLQQYCEPDRDFVGHIGGDDFIMVFRSKDWRERCQSILDAFPDATAALYRKSHLEAGGYRTENRQGVEMFHPLISLSIGVVQADATVPFSSHQIAEFAASAKSEAKKIPGNALFVERRSLLPSAYTDSNRRRPHSFLDAGLRGQTPYGV
ncbi:GGDEF domain-containing protein [Parapusillimonas sp. JC17]|uniref:GGDEF domain-containing protein n=1 Tax=Parapusillimonas sp. JC17 TaxID=3445768 RepID=UPI003FA13265